MKFYFKDEPEKLLRIDMVHRYTHAVCDGDRVISFQKSAESARALAAELRQGKEKYIRQLEAAMDQDSVYSKNEQAKLTALEIRRKYPTAGLLYGEIRRVRNTVDNIRVRELTVTE